MKNIKIGDYVYVLDTEFKTIGICCSLISNKNLYNVEIVECNNYTIYAGIKFYDYIVGEKMWIKHQHLSIITDKEKIKTLDKIRTFK